MERLSENDMSRLKRGMDEYADKVRNGTATGIDLAKALGIGLEDVSESTDDSDSYEDFRSDFVGV